MKASIIIIGDEILLGQIRDTNSGDIARLLTPQGWEIVETHVIGDDRDAIRRAVTEAMQHSDLTITTGGLGATKDDITKRVLCDLFGAQLVWNDDVEANVERIFAARGLKVNDLTRQQAWVPDKCRLIMNRYGTAPIMWFEREGKVVISMPGVPFETIGMMNVAVLEAIRQRFSPDEQRLHHTYILTGITESGLSIHLDKFESSLPQALHLAYLPAPGYLRLRLDGIFKSDSDTSIYDDALHRLQTLITPYIIYDGDATPAEIVLQRLREYGYSLSTAESCTGGNIAHCITAIAGSSDTYMGSVVSYSNSVKAHVLGVNQGDLDTYGAVSEPVVRQMAEGAARVIGTDCAVATSGIAGPGGGTPDKPVGTVWMAAHAAGQTVSIVRRLPGDRARVIDRATTEALLLLLTILPKNH